MYIQRMSKTDITDESVCRNSPLNTSTSNLTAYQKDHLLLHDHSHGCKDCSTYVN